MRGTKNEIYLHFVWATWRRQPLVTDAIERPLYRCIQELAQELNCIVLALNGLPDHIHLLVRLPARISAANLTQHVKGTSSTFAREKLCSGGFFGWQEGYGVYSVSLGHLKRVNAYIANQKQHHADNDLWPNAEQTDAEWEGHAPISA